MQNNDEINNLSKIGIYDLLKVKNPKQFHLKESIRNINRSIELLKISQRDLLTTPFSKNKRLNTAIVHEVGKQLHDACWNLLSLSESISKLATIKQNTGPLTDNALTQLLDDIQNGCNDII